MTSFFSSHSYTHVQCQFQMNNGISGPTVTSLQSGSNCGQKCWWISDVLTHNQLFATMDTDPGLCCHGVAATMQNLAQPSQCDCRAEMQIVKCGGESALLEDWRVDCNSLSPLMMQQVYGRRIHKSTCDAYKRRLTTASSEVDSDIKITGRQFLVMCNFIPNSLLPKIWFSV